MNTIPGQHLGTFMVFFNEEVHFVFYNADTREEAEKMFLTDHPTRTIVKTQTVEENLRSVTCSEESFQRVLATHRR